MDLSEDSNELIEVRKDEVDNYMEKNLNIEDEVLDNSVSHLPDAGGKRIRPVVSILSAELIGGVDYEEIIPIAAGFEALHTSSLIQDDQPSMDDHNMRRGVRTVDKKYDSAVSVLSSDILRSKATTWCTRVDRSKDIVNRVIEEFDRTVEKMCVGQRQDLAFENSTDVSVGDYLDMVSKKTAQIYSACAKCGVIIAGGSETEEKKLEEFGHKLGIGFQIIDDVLDIESTNTGKDDKSDIRNNKKTMVTIHAENNGKPVFSDEYSVQEKIGMIRDAGSVKYAKSVAHKEINKAVESIRDLDFNGSQKSAEALIEIAKSMKSRSR